MSYLKTEINKELNALVKQQHIRFWESIAKWDRFDESNKSGKIIKTGFT